MKKLFLKVSVITDGKKIDIKHIFGLMPFSCAKFTRLQAETIFGIIYPKADAWDLIYHCNKFPFDESKLKPGNIVLCYNPKSKYKDRIDSKGNKVVVTHTLLYLGVEDESGEKIFVHQYNNVQEILTLFELIGRGFIPKFIIAPKN